MTSSCPECGAHLSIVRAQDRRNTTTSTAPTPQSRHSEQPGPVSPDPGSGKDSLDSNKDVLESDNKDFRSLTKLICPCPHDDEDRPLYLPIPTFRQNVCLQKGVVGTVKQGRARETLERAATKMDAAIRRVGEGSAQALLASRRQGQSTKTKDEQVGADGVFQAIGAIIYAMEWTSDSGEPEFKNAEVLADVTNTISPNFQWNDCCGDVLELMLFVDYGFPAYSVFQRHLKDYPFLSCDLRILWPFERVSGLLAATAWRWRQGHAIPDQDAWDFIVKALGGGGPWPADEFWAWDAATMFYYYHSRRKPVSIEARRQGWTGYTGVLREMVAEVPIRGNDRLERKLSLDFHYLIPELIRDKKQRLQLLRMARNLASLYGCDIALETVVPTPRQATPSPAAPPLATSLPGLSIWEWGFSALFGSVLPRVRPSDKDSRGEEEKLLGGPKKDDGEKRGSGYGENTDTEDRSC